MIGNWTALESIVLNTVFPNSIPVNLVSVNDYAIFQNHQCFQGLFKMNESIIATKCKLANNVTIVVSSNITLVHILKNLKASAWWNNKAYFLLINTDSDNGCRSARQFLKIIWDFKILSALYFCRNKEGHVTIYNFNPYARLGSDFWKVVDDFNEESERWTLLQFYDRKLLSHGRSIRKCEDFDIDKIRNLDQHIIRIGTVKSIPRAIPKNPRLGFADYGNIDYKIFDVVLERLNARATLKSYGIFGIITKNGPIGFLKDIQLGTIDFQMSLMFIRDYWKLMTYPIDTNGVCMVTRTYPVSFAKKVMSIFTYEVCLCLVGTAFVSIITLKYTLNQSLIISSMEFLRIFTAIPSIRSPTSSRGKFFFINILLLVFIINLYIQSQLSALQTGPSSIQTIESPDDVVKSNLPIYGEVHHRELVYHPQLRERYQVTCDIQICLKRLGNVENLVCLVHLDVLKAFKYLNGEIYKAKNNLVDRPIAFTFVEDWPLASKVNSLLNGIKEAGIYSFYLDELMKSDEKTANNVIDMKQMRCCFSIFCCGCILSIFIFLVEHTVCILERTYRSTYKF